MMRRKLGEEGAIDPSSIMSVVIALIVLAVGAFAFFTVTNSLQDTLNESTNTNSSDSVARTIQNITGVSNQVFNILGVVLIIGAIMSVLGLVYSYMGTSRSSFDYDDDSISSSSSARADAVSRIVEHKPPKKTQSQFDEEKRQKEQEEKKKEKEQIHNKYFKGHTSRVGRTIKYIEDKEKEEGGKK